MVEMTVHANVRIFARRDRDRYTAKRACSNVRYLYDSNMNTLHCTHMVVLPYYVRSRRICRTCVLAGGNGRHKILVHSVDI